MRGGEEEREEKGRKGRIGRGKEEEGGEGVREKE